MEPFIAQIIMFGGNFAPRGWALCDGQSLSIGQNTALFSLLGTTYGGDGRTDFRLPDLRGRIPMHAGSGPGLTRVSLGQRGGAENHVLNASNLPSHSHTATAEILLGNSIGNNAQGDGKALAFNAIADTIYTSTDPAAVDPKKLSAASTKVTIGNAGSNRSVNHRNPYLGINFIIALVGVFPSRN